MAAIQGLWETESVDKPSNSRLLSKPPSIPHHQHSRGSTFKKGNPDTFSFQLILQDGCSNLPFVVLLSEQLDFHHLPFIFDVDA